MKLVFAKRLLIGLAACAVLTASRGPAIASDVIDPLLPSDPNNIVGVFDNGVSGFPLYVQLNALVIVALKWSMNAPTASPAGRRST